jgi:PTS system nitrogen regulatory IIA component
MGRVREVYESMMARERTMNTGIGKGVACPHVRAPGNGELICAVGWSPAGIDYGAPDGKKVHLVFMYFIPDAQKNTYLKEISSLAAALQREPELQGVDGAQDIASVRERLLGWVSAAIEARIPEARARMISLEARQAATEAQPAPGAVQVATVRVLEIDGQRPIVLCEQADLQAALEGDTALSARVRERGQFDGGGYRLVFHSAREYRGGRTLYEYWAVRVGSSPPSRSKTTPG